MNEWNFIGNQWAVTLLQKHIIQGSTRHAYLFTGPQGVGRRTLALAFAKTLNCTQPPETGTFCGSCRSCLLLDKMQHPDLSLVQRAEGKRDIAVEQIRELQRSLSFAPYEAKYRIALLKDFEDASDSAANALLKTLEEPSARVILLLTASNVESLLPTILSRCEVIRLHPVPLKDLKESLSNHVPSAQGTLISHVSGGRPGYALHLLENNDVLEKREQWLNDLQHLLSADRVERFSFFDQKKFQGNVNRQEQNADFKQMLMIWISYWRDILLKTAGATAMLENPDREAEINFIASQLPLQVVRDVILAMDQTLERVDKNANLRLCAEVLMLNFPYL